MLLSFKITWANIVNVKTSVVNHRNGHTHLFLFLNNAIKLLYLPCGILYGNLNLLLAGYLRKNYVELRFTASPN
jgi:hypothetical protein